MGFIYHYWLDLCATRGAGMSSPLPITNLEIKAWSDLRPGRFLSSRTVDLVIVIDRVFRNVWAEIHSGEDKSN